MLKPLPMRYVTLHLLSEEAGDAALWLARAGVFNPESGQLLAEQLPETPGVRYRELYASARARFDKVRAFLGDVPLPSELDAAHAVSERELQEADDWLRGVWTECSKCQEAMRRVEEARKRHAQLLKTLDIFAHLDIDLGLLREQRRFLDVQVGTLPAANLERLKQAVGLAGGVLSEFLTAEGVAHAVVAGPPGGKDIWPVLQAADWRPLQIPPEFRKRPEEVRQELMAQLARIEEDNTASCELPADTRQPLRERLAETARLLALAAPYAELAGEALRGRGGLAAISGWVPAREVQGLREALEARLPGRFSLLAREPLPGEHGRVPSALHHPRWLGGFSALVNMYGVPRYGEFDPTLLFALTYILMFGMMFGDIGQGGVIFAAALAFRRKLGRFTFFAAAAGVSSMVFGMLYGSLFGFEEIVHPLWRSPMSDPLLMLGVALAWGVGFILVATLLTIYNRLNEGKFAEALFDIKGVAGVLFYLAVLGAAYHVANGGRLGVVWLAPVLPMAAMLAYKWRETRASIGERMLVTGIEVFEGMLNYLANTLSFLRVAAFSLNHVALAVAVFTLAAMMQQTGHWIAVVLGNVFILVMEGGIVAIQALRLEFYEGFSRFFGGDGREFRPLRLGA